MAQIQLISLIGGVQAGLFADVCLLTEIFEGAGHQVTFTRGHAVGPHVLHPPRPFPVRQEFDINIFIEHCGPQAYLDQYWAEARFNVFLPNAEWFFPEWIPYLEKVDAVWAKTCDCQRIFSALCPGKVTFTSFTSRDHLRPVVKEVELFHGPGYSDLKGTKQIMKLWEDERCELPFLHFYFSEMLIASKTTDLFSSLRVMKYMGRWAPDEYAQIQNRYRFHLCLSQYEGFGHYIHEAKSTQAVVITTDAPPMNEFVRPEFGILVPPEAMHQINLAWGARICPDTLGAYLRDHILKRIHDESHWEEMGQRAREDFLNRDRYFRQRIVEVTHQLLTT